MKTIVLQFSAEHITIVSLHDTNFWNQKKKIITVLRLLFAVGPCVDLVVLFHGFLCSPICLATNC